MNQFAISTAWNADFKKDGNQIVDEIKSAGFDSIELNFKLTGDVVETISAIVKKGKIKVRSLHNYCPLPPGVMPHKASPDYYSLASLDEDERKKAIFFTKKTIEQAERLGADAVVLHCGRIKGTDHTKKLIGLYEDGKKDSDEFKKIANDMSESRASNANLYMAQALKSLDELGIFVKNKKIILGIENRFYFMEIPSLEEIGIITEKFKGSNISYWHDVGHAQVCEELGFVKHKDFLLRFGKEMSGIHLHDIKGCRDHLAPGSGNFDFSILKPYLSFPRNLSPHALNGERKSAIKVIEAHSDASSDDLKKGVGYLNNALR